MSLEYMNLPWNIFPTKKNITGLSITMVTSLPKAADGLLLGFTFPSCFLEKPSSGWLTHRGQWITGRELLYC